MISLKTSKQITSLAFCVALLLLSPLAHGAADLQRNPPECDKNSEDCGCDSGDEVDAACIKVNLDLGKTTPWTGLRTISTNPGAMR